VAEQDEEVQQQLGHLRVPDGETHQHLPTLVVVICQERGGEGGGDGHGPCLYNKKRRASKQSRRDR
jgi:hypothetical protein